jgi:hypothetical protein
MSTGKKKARTGADEMGVKGELFSTDMVKAFLENRKLRTSRPVKDNIELVYEKTRDAVDPNQIAFKVMLKGGRDVLMLPKYQPGDTVMRNLAAGELVEVDKVREFLESQLSDAYYCTRVWEAWNVGTMTEDDFEPVDVDEIMSALMDGGNNNAESYT